MATLNYTKRIQNLRDRRFDPNLQKSIISESFSKIQIPEDLKYLAESMQPIENSYNAKTIEAANNVKNHLERDLKLSFGRNYEFQGSVMTETNIKTYSDIDLLTIISSYSYMQRSISPEDVYKGNSQVDIELLRNQSVTVLRRQYDDVDDTSSKSISIYNKNLKRKVDIVPCYGYTLQKYEETNEKYWKGVYLYDFKKREKTKVDYPFAHIQNVNYKGGQTFDGSRRGIRLLKTLKADSEDRIKLSSFELTSIIHSIDDTDLLYIRGSELTIAENISSHLGRLLTDPIYRKDIKSPNGCEYPLKDDVILPQLKELKLDLDQLIIDCKSDLRNNYFEKGFKNY